MVKKFIQKATENAHGQFRRKAEEAGRSTHEFAEEHEHDSGKTGSQARLALTLMKLGHKQSHRSSKSNRESMYGKEG